MFGPTAPNMQSRAKPCPELGTDDYIRFIEAFINDDGRDSSFASFLMILGPLQLARRRVTATALMRSIDLLTIMTQVRVGLIQNQELVEHFHIVLNLPWQKHKLIYTCHVRARPKP